MVTCGLTACTPGSAPGPTLAIEYGIYLLPLFSTNTAISEKIKWELISGLNGDVVVRAKIVRYGPLTPIRRRAPESGRRQIVVFPAVPFVGRLSAAIPGGRRSWPRPHRPTQPPTATEKTATQTSNSWATSSSPTDGGREFSLIDVERFSRIALRSPILRVVVLKIVHLVCL